MSIRAVMITEFGGPEVLQIGAIDRPEPSDTQVLIKVAAAGVNRPDCLQREGHYPPPKGASDILGLEVAGTVVAVGSKVSGFRKGDQVCALVAGGGYADYCVADARNVLSVPNGVSLVEAAAIPETYFTVWHNVFQRGGLKAGERFLVHGATSGIGTTGIMLAKHAGAYVFATAGSDDKCDFARTLGADIAVNYKKDDFVQLIDEYTDGQGIDLILDMVGGDYTDRNLKIAAMDGRIVQIAFQKGRKVDIDLMKIMTKRLTLTGSTLRARSVAFKAQIADELERVIWPELSKGNLKPIIDRVFNLNEAQQAHEYMEEGLHKGKIVLTAEPHNI